MKRSLCAWAIALLAVASASAETIVAVVGNNLFSFDSATPGTLLTGPIVITGLQLGESIEAIDFRPSNGLLYGLGIQFTSPITPIPIVGGAVGNTGRLYTINTATGAATLVGSGPFSSTLQGNSFGFDFDPIADVVRLVSNGEDNLQIDPTTGVATADTPLSPAGNVAGAAYDRNTTGSGVTTLYDIDWFGGTLATQGGIDGTPSPNGGVVTAVGPLGVTTTAQVGFDISGATGTAYASLSPPTGGQSALYIVNLGTGAATLVGTIGIGGIVADISCPPPTPTPTPSFTASVTITPTSTPTFTGTPTVTLAPVTFTSTPIPGPSAAVPMLSVGAMALLAVALAGLGYAVMRRGGE